MKRVSLGLGIGVVVGFLVSKKIKSDALSPENALKKVKIAVKEEHNVSGSWIHMKPETIERFGLKYSAYRGGLTSPTNDGVVQYEFLADTKTGVLLSLEQM
ncbi:PepSY domain-containing protein [Shouchella shacheensis]|uniref:PepSY domain-containing protein n=1 Tax=Shouchella shacheensis TaxID=1649580 RepID=UPI0007401977|nr:PepSY domain-containing protein [Shouchella shacheensis]